MNNITIWLNLRCKNMNVNDYALNLAKKNFKESPFSDRAIALLEYTKQLISEFNPKANVYIAGSRRSKTSVIGKSDIDIIVTLPYPIEGMRPEELHTYLLSLPGFLQNSMKLNLYGRFDPPAFVIEDLEFENSERIEITSVCTTKIFGGPDYEFFLLNRFGDAIVTTSPNWRNKVVEYLNSKTDNYFSYVDILIKIFGNTLKLDLFSFAIDCFLFYWFRGTYVSSRLDTKKKTNELNISFDISEYTGSRGIFYLTYMVLTTLARELELESQKNKIFEMENPYLTVDVEPVHFCESVGEQISISRALSIHCEHMKSFFDREVSVDEMSELFFGDNTTGIAYELNCKSFYFLRLQCLTILKSIRKTTCGYGRELAASAKHPSLFEWMYFELLLLLSRKVDHLSLFLMTAQRIEYDKAIKELFEYLMIMIKLCISLSVRNKIIGISNSEKIDELKLKLQQLLPMFLTDKTFKWVYNDIKKTYARCENPYRNSCFPFMLKWEESNKEVLECIYMARIKSQEDSENINLSRELFNVIPEFKKNEFKKRKCES